MASVGAARAADTGSTIGLGIVPPWLSDAPLNGAPATGAVSFDSGWTTTGSVGLALDRNWRAEVEIGYRGDEPRNLLNVSGDANAWSGLGNLIYDMDTSAGWTPYIGAGIGALRYRASGLRTSPGGLGDDDTVLAYQGLLGISYSVTPNSRFFFDYRYLRSDAPKARDAAGNSARPDYPSSTVLMGWRFTLPQAGR